MANPYLDDPALRAAFAAESSEHLESLERGLVAIEQQAGRPAEDVLRSLMRSAHTLKASARLFQLSAAAELAHHVEETLIGMQRGTLPADHEQVGALLRAVDALRQAMRLPELATAAAGDGLTPASPAPPAVAAEYVRVSAARLQAIFHIAESWARIVQEERRHSERLATLVAEIAALRQALLARLGDAPDPADAALRAHSARVQMAAEALLRERRALLRALAEQTAELQARASELHLRSLASILGPLGRALREEATRQGKEVVLSVIGDEIELDDYVLQRLGEALTHLARNALDHGIEQPEERRRRGKPVPGTITIRTRTHGDTATIEVCDDGRGIDLGCVREQAVRRGLLSAAMAASASDDELLELIFRPGFSTRATVDETAGRGIGMDIVQERVTRLGGRIAVQTTAGQGTVFRLTVPLAASTTSVLLVQVGSVAYAIPTMLTRGVVRVPPSGLTVLALAPAQVPGNAPSADFFVLLGEHEPTAALRADAVLAEATAVLRSFNPALGRPPFVSGVALRPDGSLALLLDPAELVARGRVSTAAHRALVAGDTASRDWLRAALGDTWAVLGASHGVQALAMAVHRGVDLLVVTASLPGLDGLAVIRLLKADRRTAHLPVVLLADVASELEAAAVAAGATAVVERTASGQAELARLAGTIAAP